MVNWKEFGISFEDFTEEMTQEWINCGFNKKGTREWLESGLKSTDASFARWLLEIESKDTNWFLDYGNEKELRKQYQKYLEEKDWKSIHQDFTPELQKEWEDRGFSYEEVKEWIDIGMKFVDTSFCAWLRDTLQKTPENILNHGSDKDLRKQYSDYLKEKWKELGFSKEQIKEWGSAGTKLDDYEFVTWLRDTKKLGPEWITNYKEDYQELSERFKKYGVCSKCENPNTGEKWCQSCNAFRFQKNFSNWTSSNLEIDQFIQKYQLEATEANKLLEWIPYEQFKNIEYLAEGGFGKVYKAQWTEGSIHYWNTYEKQWNREKDYYYEEDRWGYKVEKNKDYKTIVLKSLTNSQENTNFLQETANHKIIDDWFNSIVPCYGISQDPQTGNYLMVIKYIEGGNLRQYLTSKKLNFADKLKRLTNIIQGLKDIHQKNLVHRDFHSGNILNSEIQSFITDLGLCKPVNEVNEEEKIYGVLPYVAPEVLQKKSYTLASDIYSLGVVAYEIFANSSPYLDRNYDILLAVEICQGLRPNLEELRIPQKLKDLIQNCWDTDPNKRPTASKLERALRNWQRETEFVSQLQTIEAEYNQKSQNTTYKFHPTAIMNSKLISTKEITKLLETEKNSSQLSEITEKVQESNKDVQELLRNIQVLKKGNDNLTKQLESTKKILFSLLKENNRVKKTEIKTQELATLKAVLNLKTQDLTIIMKKLNKPREENIQLKEIFNIIFHDKKFDFSALKTEIVKLKNESLSYQIQIRKTELDELVSEAKRKLGEESEFLLEILLNTQINIVKLTDDSIEKSLTSLRTSLSKKIAKEEIELICKKQKEVVQLEETIEILRENKRRNLEVQVEIPPKY